MKTTTVHILNPVLVAHNKDPKYINKARDSAYINCMNVKTTSYTFYIVCIFFYLSNQGVIDATVNGPVVHFR